jgi:hypothetical protein
MNMKLILSLTGFTLALGCTLWSGCKEKDDCPPCGDAYKTIPQEMKDWALFDDGSWWVYRLAEDTTVYAVVGVITNNPNFSPVVGLKPSLLLSRPTTIFFIHKKISYFCIKVS